MKIPKIIHFVWAGQKRLMPDLSIATILKWHIRNPNFDIYLWVDYRTSPSYLDVYYLQRFKTVAQYLFLQEGLNLEKIKIKDIEAESVSQLLVRYEIDRLRPNFGASSDLLRVLIVQKYGGAYFDSDVLPSLISLEASSIFEEDVLGHRLFLHCNSQGSGLIGNDAFFSTVENPHLNLIYQFILGNYQRTDEGYRLYDSVLRREVESITPIFNPLIRQLYSYDKHNDGEYIERITPNKTGGGPFRATVQETEVDGVLFRDLSPYIEETINHRAWINQALIGSTSSEETMERIISSIRFEVEDLGMLRLDDHIDNFSSLTGLNLDRAGQIIVDRLNREEIDYRGLRGIQVKLTNPHSLSFYHQRNFPFYLSFWIPHHSEATPFEHVDFIAVMLDELCQSSAHRINFAYFFAFILHRYADFIESYAPFSIAKKIEVERCLHVMHAKLQLMDRTEFYPRLQRFLNLLLSCVQHNRHCTLMSCFQPNPYYLLELARTTPEFAIEWRENSAKGKEVIPESTISFNNYGLRDADIASLVLNSLVSAKQLFSGLNCLDLSSNNLSDDSVPLLNTLPAIKDLRLRRNNFRSEVVSLFARPMLESLDLTENPLSESTAVAIRQEKRITIHFTPRLFGNIEKLTSLQWSDAVLESEEASLMTSTLPAVAQG